MRKEQNVIILERNDLINTSIGKSILLIGYSDFVCEMKEKLLKGNIVLFVDNNGQTKIIKNRYGDNGCKMFIETIEEMKFNICSAQSAGFKIGEEYFDDIISLYK